MQYWIRLFYNSSKALENPLSNTRFRPVQLLHHPAGRCCYFTYVSNSTKIFIIFTGILTNVDINEFLTHCFCYLGTRQSYSFNNSGLRSMRSDVFASLLQEWGSLNVMDTYCCKYTYKIKYQTCNSCS